MREFNIAINCDVSAPPVLPLGSYDECFRAKVQESLDDIHEETCSHDEVMAAAQVIIDNKRLEKELRERVNA